MFYNLINKKVSVKNPLHNELEELRYISISSIDPYDIPESVVIYFKNNSEVNKKMSIETIHGTQIDLQNQNPTIVLENYKATFCLGSTPYVPTVTIDPIDDILDPEYPREITFTGTVSRTDDYIPNDILAEYVGITMRASLVDDTHWTVTFDLQEVTVDTTQTVSAIANSIDVNNPNQEGVFSDPVEEQFNVLFTEVECIPSVNSISCLCLDVTKTYKVTVDGQSVTGTFEEVVAFLDSNGLYAYPGETACNSPLPPKEISCEGATDTSGCIDIEGLWDLEIDGIRILSDVTPQQIESYLINESPHITNHPSCCPEGYYRSVYLPYPIQEGSTVYIPIALTPDGESITTHMVAQGPDPYNNIGEQLAIQLEPHGLYAHNSMFSNTHRTSFGITYYDATDYNNTFFYILDEGNTFSEEQMPRGLPPYYCFFPT